MYLLMNNEEQWTKFKSTIIDCKKDPSVRIIAVHFHAFIFCWHVPKKFFTLLKLNSVLQFTIVN